jgi:hypothetical protein
LGTAGLAANLAHARSLFLAFVGGERTPTDNAGNFDDLIFHGVYILHNEKGILGRSSWPLILSAKTCRSDTYWQKELAESFGKPFFVSFDPVHNCAVVSL